MLHTGTGCSSEPEVNTEAEFESWRGMLCSVAAIEIIIFDHSTTTTRAKAAAQIWEILVYSFFNQMLPPVSRIAKGICSASSRPYR